MKRKQMQLMSSMHSELDKELIKCQWLNKTRRTPRYKKRKAEARFESADFTARRKRREAEEKAKEEEREKLAHNAIL